MGEHNLWKIEENLENAKEMVVEFGGRLNVEVR